MTDTLTEQLLYYEAGAHGVGCEVMVLAVR
jgi:hypothetical protein